MASSWYYPSTFGSFFRLCPACRYTPLGIAIVFNHQEIALRLLDHPDIDVNKKTCESTALHYAALRNNVVLLEAICAKPEVQVNQKDYMNDGVTPLAIAVKNKHADAVRQLSLIHI